MKPSTAFWYVSLALLGLAVVAPSFGDDHGWRVMSLLVHALAFVGAYGAGLYEGGGR